MNGADPLAKVDARIECDGWSSLECDVLADRCFAAVEASNPDVNWPVSVLFTDNATITKLNEYFRGKKQPTNVLSFPPGDIVWPDYDYLGDIALAYETCRDEAAAKGVSLSDHAAHLLVHGMLHLIGYDHQDDGEAEKMERREAAILKTLGIADPYANAMEAAQ